MLELISCEPDWTWLATGIIGLATWLLVRHILQVRSLPPGPFPFPVLGNLLGFRGEGNELPNVLNRLCQKHKDMFTLWLGPKPSIFVCSWDLCHEALIAKRNNFSGRITRGTGEILLAGHDDVSLTDFGPCWETLRKVLSTAIRKYAVSDNLAELVSEIVDHTTEEMTEDGNAVDNLLFFNLVVYNVLASSAFGKRFETDDPDFLKLRKSSQELNTLIASGVPSDALPILKVFYKKRLGNIDRVFTTWRDYIKLNFKEHQGSFQAGDIRDFTDAVLSARDEAEAESKDCLQYLTEGNMINVLVNLFIGGTDSTRNLLQWIFLHICDKPEMQKRMQQEIDQNIGTRPPRQADKYSLPFVTAVITETLRYNPVLDFTLEHKTTCHTELGGYKIPKDTSCMFYFRGSHNNPAYWDEPEKFDPERFLDTDGKLSTARCAGYMPFGLGRRACPGEKLALADSFLVTTRLLQKYSFRVQGGTKNINLSTDFKTIGNFAPPYQLVITRRDVGGGQ